MFLKAKALPVELTHRDTILTVCCIGVKSPADSAFGSVASAMETTSRTVFECLRRLHATGQSFVGESGASLVGGLPSSNAFDRK